MFADRRPVSPKAHGAWLGAGTGTSIGSAIIALLQNDVVHHALSTPVQGLIMGVTGAVVAYLGSWLMPLSGSGQVLVREPELSPGEQFGTLMTPRTPAQAPAAPRQRRPNDSGGTAPV